MKNAGAANNKYVCLFVSAKEKIKTGISHHAVNMINFHDLLFRNKKYMLQINGIYINSPKTTLICVR